MRFPALHIARSFAGPSTLLALLSLSAPAAGQCSLQELKRDFASADARDRFGSSVTLSGSWAAVGVPGADVVTSTGDVRTKGGRVVLFERDEITYPAAGVFTNFFTNLNVNGKRSAFFELPPSSDPGLSGVTLYHAYSTFDALLEITSTSNAVPVRLVP